MDGYNIYADPALRGKTPWPLIASSLWFRLGLVAAMAVIVVVTQFYKGDAGFLSACAWILAAAWLAAYSWRRALYLIDRLDEAAAVSEAMAPNAPAPKATTHAQWDRREVRATPVAPQVRG